MDNTGSISKILSRALEERGLTPGLLAEKTDVPEDFIENLLEERFDGLPAIPYTHGYVVKIADALDIDGEDLWRDYLKGRGELRGSGQFDKLPENRFVTTSNKWGLLVVVGVVVLIGYFALSSIFGTDLSKKLVLENMDDNLIRATSSDFIIRGGIDPGLAILVNGARAELKDDGSFEESVRLEPGFNTIQFTIKGLFGKENTVIKQVYYEVQKNEESLNDPTIEVDETFSLQE